MSSGLKFDFSGLLKGLAEAELKLRFALEAYAKTSAAKLENYAKRNARWTDRTGDARNRLKGSSEAYGSGYRLSLAQGVTYGIWLEFAHERKYAIIEETINIVGNKEIMPGLSQLFRRLS